MTGVLHEDQYTFFIVSHSALIEWETYQTSCRRNQNTIYVQ